MSANKNPTGLVVCDGKVWVTDDKPNNQNDRVYVYTTGGTPLGNWELDPANRDAAGITLDPSGGTTLWVVDRHDSRVYTYTGTTGLTGGAQTASGTFDLAAGNHHAEGIADPAPSGWAEPPSPAAPHTPPAVGDFAALIDVTPPARLEYRTTYDSWEAGELRAEARLTNLSPRNSARPAWGPARRRPTSPCGGRRPRTCGSSSRSPARSCTGPARCGRLTLRTGPRSGSTALP